MLPLRVILLRTAALGALYAGSVVASAGAATGGAGLPGGIQASSSAPSHQTPSGDTPSADAGDVAATTPTATDAGPEGTTTALVAQLPTLPVLATAARRADDPVTQDLAALVSPTQIAAIDGHVVIVQPRGGLSDLVDLLDPTAPRVLLTSTRLFGTPLAGRDANGRPVVVVSPCSGSPATANQGQTPRCPLRAIDLQTGTSVALPSTSGALAGDLSGTRLVFSRTSPQTGVRLYESSGGAAATAIPLPALLGPDVAATPVSTPVAGTVRAPTFDIDAAGRLAVVLEHGARAPRYTSALWLRATAGAWTRIASVSTAFTGMGTRHILGPRLDPTGVSAYVEGVVEAPSYLGRWNDDGTSSSQTSLRRSIGRSTILNATAFDSGRLLFVDWSPGEPCGTEEAPACGLRSVGPLSAQ